MRYYSYSFASARAGIAEKWLYCVSAQAIWRELGSRRVIRTYDRWQLEEPTPFSHDLAVGRGSETFLQDQCDPCLEEQAMMLDPELVVFARFFEEHPDVVHLLWLIDEAREEKQEARAYGLLQQFHRMKHVPYSAHLIAVFPTQLAAVSSQELFLAIRPKYMQPDGITERER